MAERERGTVVFDLDGTLVDSAPDLADTLDIVMAEERLGPFGLAGMRALIGHGIPALVQGALKQRGRESSAAMLDALVARFVVVYSERLSNRTKPYPGAIEALTTLRRRDWRLVVCTNKRAAAAQAILSNLGFIDIFAVVAGPDTFGVGKPDPGHLLGTLPTEFPNGYRVVLVGDSDVDVATARAACVPVIACAWGYARMPADKLEADAVAWRFDEVPDLVDQLAATPGRILQSSLKRTRPVRKSRGGDRR